MTLVARYQMSAVSCLQCGFSKGKPVVYRIMKKASQVEQGLWYDWGVRREGQGLSTLA